MAVANKRGLTRILKAVAAVGFMAPMAHAATTGFNQTGAGPYDYDDPANWVGGDITGEWNPSLTLTTGQIVTFDNNYSLAGGLTFGYSANLGVAFRSDSATARTLTLNGDVNVTMVNNTVVTIGHATNAVNLDLNGTRTFTILGSRSLTLLNSATNGSIVRPTAANGGTLNLNGANNSLGGLLQNIGTTSLGAGGGTNISSGVTISGGTFNVNHALTLGTGLLITATSTTNLNAATVYTGGSTVQAGTLAIGASGTAGSNTTGNDILVSPGAILTLAAAGSTGANQQIQIGSNSATMGVLGLGYNGTPTATTSRVGSAPIVVAINTTAGFNAVTDQSSYLGGGNYFGSTGTGVYTAGSMTAASDNIYRLGGGGGTLTIANGALTGSAGILINSTLTNGGGTVALAGANTTTGTATVNAGTLRFAGTGGSLLNGNVFVDRAATLALDSSVAGNTGAARTNIVTLHHSNLVVTGNTGATSTDSIGTLTLVSSAQTQLPIITMNAVNDATKSTRLQIGSIDRQNGVLLVRGGGLGGNSFGNSISSIFVTSAPGTVGGGGAAGTSNVSIVPWIIGGTTPTDGGSTFVTYDANGLRPLTTAEYATNFAGPSTNNVRVDSAVSLSSSATVNSLVINNVALTGSTVNVTSGAVLFVGTSSNATGLNFGSAQGVIGYTRGRNFQAASVITLAGTGGVVLYGTRQDESFDFAAASTYRGDTYIYANTGIWGANVLPYASSVLTGSEGTRTGDVYLYGQIGWRANATINGLNGTGLLNAAGSNATTITLGDNNANADFSGLIQDNGALAMIKIGSGTQRISGNANTTRGTVTVRGGVLEITSIGNQDETSSIGTLASSGLILNGGTLRYVGGGNSSERTFSVGETTNAATGTFESSGAGALTFTSTAALGYGTAGTTGAAQTRTLVLGGTNTGANTLSQLVGQNGSAVNGNSDVNLIKNGAGRWVISNANTYRGTTSINAGTLQVSSGGVLGATAGADVYVASGATLQLDGTSAIDDLAELFLTSVSGTYADVILNSAGTETVSGLYFNGVAQAGGTWGATGSGATYINDDFFSGSGTLTVVPEPASLSLVALGAGALLTRRRRSR